MKSPLKNLLLGLLIGTILCLFTLGLMYLATGEALLDDRFLKDARYTFLYSVVLTFVNKEFFEFLSRRKFWLRYSGYRILIGAVGSIILTMAGVFLIRVLVETSLEGKSWEQFLEGESALYYAVALMITLVISVIFHAVYFYKHWQETKVKEQKIIASTASARFDALKHQLDPHFLFNSLNVLTSLIEEDPGQAQKFTTALSKVYRYVLEQKHKDLVTVDEELQFAKTYVELLKMRFEDSIVFDIPETGRQPEAKIVPLSLQLLLENAVKHNMVTASRPLRLRVYESEGMLVITNNLQEKQVVKKSSGVGLHNIKQRYGMLTDRQVVINKTASEFEVRLPILTKQIAFMETQEAYLEDKRYQKAKERVEKIKGFFGNLVAYCLVIPLLAWLNWRTTHFPWVVFPMLGWGFGLLMHGWEAYGNNPIWGRNWEAKKIRELMEKEDF